MEGINRTNQLREEAQPIGDSEWPSAQTSGQRLAIELLHGQKRTLVGERPIGENFDHTGVGDLGEKLGLGKEAFALALGRHECGMEDFQRDLAMSPTGEVDHAASTLAEQAENPKLTETTGQRPESGLRRFGHPASLAVV